VRDFIETWYFSVTDTNTAMFHICDALAHMTSEMQRRLEMLDKYQAAYDVIDIVLAHFAAYNRARINAGAKRFLSLRLSVCVHLSSLFPLLFRMRTERTCD
jgi:hypothetical protein